MKRTSELSLPLIREEFIGGISGPPRHVFAGIRSEVDVARFSAKRGVVCHFSTDMEGIPIKTLLVHSAAKLQPSRGNATSHRVVSICLRFGAGAFPLQRRARSASPSEAQAR